jgi:hypothetical protein
MIVPYSWVLGSPSCIWVMLHFFCWSERIHTLICVCCYTRIMEPWLKWNLSVPEELFSLKDQNFKFLQVLLLNVTILERKINLIPCRSVIDSFHCMMTDEFLHEFSQGKFVFLFGRRNFEVWQFFSAIMEYISLHIACRYFCQIY